MIVLRKLLAFAFDSPLGRASVGAGILLGLVAAFAGQQRNIGAAKATAKIEKATTHAIEIGTRAAAKSGGELVEVPGIWPRALWGGGGARPAARRVLGQRDPTTRDD